MGLYERILAEREEEEKSRGRPLGVYRGVDSVVLDRLAKRASEGLERLVSSEEYMVDMLRLYRFVHRGPRNWASAMHFGQLRNRYPEEYCLLEAERDGEFYDQEDLFGAE